MYCPRCQSEYRDGFTECSDCGAPLVEGAAPAPSPDAFDPALGLVVVLETTNPIQLALAKGALDDNGIPYFVLGQIATLITDIDPFLFKCVRLQVPCDREQEARALLDAVLQPVETLPEDAEAGPEETGAAE
jgi:hypothetical protein